MSKTYLKSDHFNGGGSWHGTAEQFRVELPQQRHLDETRWKNRTWIINSLSDITTQKCSECVGIEKIDDFGFVLPKLAFATIYSCNGLNYCNYRTRRAEAWRAVLDLVDRGLRRPAFLIVDGASGLSVHFKTAVLLLRETTMCSSIFSLTSRLAIRLRSTSRAFCQMSVE